MAGKEICYEKYRYLLLHKPAGYVSATTDNRDQTVLELLPEGPQNLFPVGKALMRKCRGLFLLTGGRISHTSCCLEKHVDKTYAG